MPDPVHDELTKINQKMQAHNESDDRRFGELTDVGQHNARTLGRIEGTLASHGVLLVDINNKAAITNGRVTDAEKELDLIADRASRLAITRAAALSLRHGVVIAACSGSAGVALTLTLKAIGVA